MRELKKVIAAHQDELRKHRLFELVETISAVEQIATLARAASWWPMVFQDVLRLNVERVRGSGLERFAEYHRKEDFGHDQWFLEDLMTLGVQPPGLDELFEDEFQSLRDACYSLVGEVLSSRSGGQRIAVVLAIEAAGHLFFEAIAAAVDRVCPLLPLRYFARSHLGVEKSHDLFSESTEAELDQIVLGAVERVRCEEMVVRIRDTFAVIFSHYADRMQEGVRSASHVRELAVPAGILRSVRHARGS
jgi:hypothetical protein